MSLLYTSKKIESRQEKLRMQFEIKFRLTLKKYLFQGLITIIWKKIIHI